VRPDRPDTQESFCEENNSKSFVRVSWTGEFRGQSFVDGRTDTSGAAFKTSGAFCQP
jgi:hypothetical protein